VSAGAEIDVEHMNRAVAAAARVRLATSPRPWVGAVVVSEDGAVFEGATDGQRGPHAEVMALRAAGPQRAKGATLYTTLSPCQMCAGTALLYGIPRVVIGENRTFEASEQWLRANGVDVVVLDLPECVDLMAEFIAAEPQLWNEDIGVEDAS